MINSDNKFAPGRCSELELVPPSPPAITHRIAILAHMWGVHSAATSSGGVESVVISLIRPERQIKPQSSDMVADGIWTCVAGRLSTQSDRSVNWALSDKRKILCHFCPLTSYRSIIIVEVLEFPNRIPQQYSLLTSISSYCQTIVISDGHGEHPRKLFCLYFIYLCSMKYARYIILKLWILNGFRNLFFSHWLTTMW
jgi:hypothetical protein